VGSFIKNVNTNAAIKESTNLTRDLFLLPEAFESAVIAIKIKVIDNY
jgi:hypothetical protein